MGIQSKATLSKALGGINNGHLMRATESVQKAETYVNFFHRALGEDREAPRQPVVIPTKFTALLDKQIKQKASAARHS